MKAIKVIGKILIAIVILVVVAVLTLPLWFGPVVRCVANTAVPRVVKTDFNLGVLSLNPYTGRFELGDMQLANPQGYPEKFAATVGDVVLDVGMMSLAGDTVHIEEIKVKDIFVSVVKNNEGVGNFQQIQYNVAGGKEKYEAQQAEKAKLESVKKAEGTEEKSSASGEESEKPSKKFVIDRLEISGLHVQLGVIPIALPSITLTDIGKKSNGATIADVWNEILGSVMKAAGSLGDGLKALGGLTSDAAGAATKAVGDVTGKAAESAGTATKAVGDAAGKAVDSVGEGAKKAADALKSLF